MWTWEEGVAAGLAFSLACAAGVVAFLQQFAEPLNDRKWVWKTLFIKGLTAGFAGILCFWLLPRKGLDERYLYFLIALAGWGGGETISFLQTLFYRAINLIAERQERKNINGKSEKES